MALTEKQRDILKDVRHIMVNFHQAFNRPLNRAFLAEIYVAEELKLSLCEDINHPGYDAIDNDDKKYQIKFRGARTLNIDVTKLDFDFLILVNLNEDNELSGMWCESIEGSKRLLKPRKDKGGNIKKYQVTQKIFKTGAKRIFPKTSAS